MTWSVKATQSGVGSLPVVVNWSYTPGWTNSQPYNAEQAALLLIVGASAVPPGPHAKGADDFIGWWEHPAPGVVTGIAIDFDTDTGDPKFYSFEGTYERVDVGTGRVIPTLQSLVSHPLNDRPDTIQGSSFVASHGVLGGAEDPAPAFWTQFVNAVEIVGVR